MLATRDVCKGEKWKQREKYNMVKLLCYMAGVSIDTACSLDDLDKYPEQKRLCYIYRSMQTFICTCMMVIMMP